VRGAELVGDGSVRRDRDDVGRVHESAALDNERLVIGRLLGAVDDRVGVAVEVIQEVGDGGRRVRVEKLDVVITERGREPDDSP